MIAKKATAKAVRKAKAELHAMKRKADEESSDKDSSDQGSTISEQEVAMAEIDKMLATVDFTEKVQETEDGEISC